jgi:hypothetical protein
LLLGALVLPLPALVQVMQSGLVEPSIRAGTWLADPVLGTIHARFGLPAMVQLWLLPVVVAGVAWILPIALERLARALRIDPHDHAWTSFTWALRSWRGALRWLAIVVLPTLALFAAWYGLWKAHVLLMPEPTDPDKLLGLLFLSAPFFLLDARNLVAGTPPRRWSARWPVLPVWILYGAMFAVLGLIGLQARIDAYFEAHPDIASRLVLVLVLWLIGLMSAWMVDLAWLSRAGWSGLPGVWRRGLHPRVLATSALQWLRPTLYFILALLPLALWVWFFVGVAPMAEEALYRQGFGCCSDCCALGGFWGPIVTTSRWLVSWWWLLMVIFLGLVGVLLHCVLPWFGTAAWARLMVERGVIDATPIVTSQSGVESSNDCGDAAGFDGEAR